MKSDLVSALLACVLLVNVPALSAEPAKPAKKAAEAVAAKAGKQAAARDFRGAAEGYESAYGQMPNAKWLLAAASAREKNGEPVLAAADCERYLKEAPASAAGRPTAKKMLAALTAKLGRLEIKVQ